MRGWPCRRHRGRSRGLVPADLVGWAGRLAWLAGLAGMPVAGRVGWHCGLVGRLGGRVGGHCREGRGALWAGAGGTAGRVSSLAGPGRQAWRFGVGILCRV